MPLNRFHALRPAAMAMTLFLASLYLTRPVEATEVKTAQDAPATARVGMPAPGFSLEGVVSTAPGKEFKTVRPARLRSIR